MKEKSWKKEEKCVDCNNCLGTRFDKVYCKVYIDDVARLFRIGTEEVMRSGGMYPPSYCIYYRKREKSLDKPE